MSEKFSDLQENVWRQLMYQHGAIASGTKKSLMDALHNTDMPDVSLHEGENFSGFLNDLINNFVTHLLLDIVNRKPTGRNSLYAYLRRIKLNSEEDSDLSSDKAKRIIAFCHKNQKNIEILQNYIATKLAGVNLTKTQLQTKQQEIAHYALHQILRDDPFMNDLHQNVRQEDIGKDHTSIIKILQNSHKKIEKVNPEFYSGFKEILQDIIGNFINSLSYERITRKPYGRNNLYYYIRWQKLSQDKDLSSQRAKELIAFCQHNKESIKKLERYVTEKFDILRKQNISRRDFHSGMTQDIAAYLMNPENITWNSPYEE